MFFYVIYFLSLLSIMAFIDYLEKWAQNRYNKYVQNTYIGKEIVK